MTQTTVDAEAAFVGAVLHLPAPAAAAALDLVHDDDVADPRLAVILGAARRLASIGIPPDPVSVLSMTRALGTVTGREAVRALTVLLADLYGGCPLPASVRWYAVAVLEEAVRRRSTEMGTRITQAAHGGSLDALVELVATEAAAVLELARRRTTVFDQVAQVVNA